MSVQVLLPSALGEVTGGVRRVDLDLAPDATVGDVIRALGDRFPRLARRLCDEAGALRRFVNVYVDGCDVRGEGGLGAGVADGAVVQVLPSVAGG
jgi:molybdopterin synthase sulfur carrier subunit